MIGTLASYATTSQLNSAINNLSGGQGGFITLTDLTNALSAYALTSSLNSTYVNYTYFNDVFNYFYNKSETDSLLNNKQKCN